MTQAMMQVFNQYMMPVIMQKLAQQIALFNAASRGTLVLSAEGFTGDFLQRSFYNSLAGARRRVDRYAANSAQAATDLTQGKHSAVKVAGGFGPVLFEPSQMTWLEKPTAEGIDVISGSLTEMLMQDMLNTAIAALVGAIGNQAGATNDVSATAGVDYAAMNNTHALFGDASGNLVASVMTGAMYHKLIGRNLSNTQNLFQASNVNVIDILGKSVIVTDAPALFVSGTPDKNKVLSLTTNAAVITNAGDLITNIQTTNGKQRIETTFQADYTFGVSLKGYTWDETNGGKSPTDAELATGTNWDLVENSIKHTAGVLTIGDASK